MPLTRVAQPSHNPCPAEHFACAVIDELGREIPITEDMILQACRELDPVADEPDARDA